MHLFYVHLVVIQGKRKKLIFEISLGGHGRRYCCCIPPMYQPLVAEII